MTVDIKKSWLGSRFGYLSLIVSLAEIIVVWGAVALVNTPERHDIPLIVKVTDFAWLLGGLGSLGTAVAGCVADSNRIPALAGVAAAIFTFFVCGLTKLV